MALQFDGINDAVGSLTPFVTGNVWTIYCRFKLLNSGSIIFSIPNLSSDNNYIRFDAGTSGSTADIRGGGSTPESSGWASLDAGNIDGNWHDVIFISRSSTDHEVYIDGVSTDTSSIDSTATGLNRTFLAFWTRLSGSGITWGNCIISEFATWTVALTDEQITQLSGGFKGTVLGIEKDNLTSYTPLDDYPDGQNVDSLDFRDESGSGNPLTNATESISVAEPVMSYYGEPILNDEILGVNETENLTISDSILITETTINENENLNISDDIIVDDTTVQQEESLEISDNIIISSTNTDAKFISKIISINPLIFITDTNPVEIIKVDISTPESPTWVVQTISNLTTANDISINFNDEYIYIAGNNGKIVKIEIADLGNQETIDVSDSDDLLTIETNTNFGVTYAGTDNDIGELYLIDERDTFLINSDFQALSEQQLLLNTSFQITDRFKIDSNFQALGVVTFKISTDFKCLTKPTVAPPVGVNRLDVIEPIKETDYHVFLDDIELENTDLILNSISITHSVGEESRASFRLTRKHDNLNTTLEGITKIITNQNEIKIICNGRTIFPFNGVGTGRISNISAVYQNNTEYVDIEALSEEAPNKFNNITMPLPSLTSRLSLYDILLQNPQINNPYVDPNNEINPKKFKGIKVNLGQKIEQNNQRFFIFDANGNIADKIQESTFNPQQNWTYFWSPTVKKIEGVVLQIPETTEEEDELAKFNEEQRKLPINERRPHLRNAIRIRQTLQRISDGIQNTLDTISKNIRELIPLNSIQFLYIGTSLAPVAEDLWDLKQATHWRQAINDDSITGNISMENVSPGVLEVVETILPSSTPHDYGHVPVEYTTYYKIGEAPFKEISVRNGIKRAKPRLVDEHDGLYSIKDTEYDFRNFAKKIADLEYEQLKNINGDFLPDTSCSFNMTIDAYLYYDISLLTRINIDNTTSANIYNNSNGFPVSAKSITITSGDRKVSINADNTKSTKELEELNNQFPDENDSEYNIPSTRTLIALKSDMRTRLEIERNTIIQDQRIEQEGDFD